MRAAFYAIHNGVLHQQRLARLLRQLTMAELSGGGLARTSRMASGRSASARSARSDPSRMRAVRVAAQLEVLAAISAYFTFPELFVGRRVHHWVDNTVALSALVHGYSGKADLAKMVNVFYLQVAGLRTSVYFDYVPSKANIADLPSRDAFDELEHELRGLHVARALPGGLSVPSFLQWRAPLASWVTRFLHLPGNWAA